MQTDVLIIGGGVVGASVAYHLAERSMTRVVVAERKTLGSGATGRSVGGIRQQFSSNVNIELSRASVELFEHMSRKWSGRFRFVQAGYLFLFTDKEQLSEAEKGCRLQQQKGVAVEMLTPREIEKKFPYLRCEDILAGTFTARDGYADAYEANVLFAEEAARRGVAIFQETEVLGFEIHRGRIATIHTSRGSWEADWVVNAAGAYAANVGNMAQLQLPVRPYPVHVFATESFDGIGEGMPVIIDYAHWLFLRQELRGILMGMNDPAQESTFELKVNWELAPEVAEKAIWRVPALERAGLKTAWTGLIEVTPDEHPILGPTPGLENFIQAVGFSGYGFMMAPIVGRLIAEQILDGSMRSIDVSSLSIERFQNGTGQNQERMSHWHRDK